MLSGAKLYLYAGLAVLAVAGEGYIVAKAYSYGATYSAAQYEITLAKLGEEQAAETKRQAEDNQVAQETLNKQLVTLQDQNTQLQKTLDGNKKAAAIDPHAHTVAVNAASVQRLRAIRGH